MPKDIYDQAAANLEALRDNPYPGRGIIIGLDESGKRLVQISFITGRSPGSRNRCYVYIRSGLVRTRVADPAKETGDPEKTIYGAMAGDSGVYVVSNGRQTDTVAEYWGRVHAFTEAMCDHTYEDDSISTPRITAVCIINGNKPCRGAMSILRRSPFCSGCDRNFFWFEQFCPGIGHMLTTYLTDGDPPPIFEGEPRLLPLVGSDPKAIAETLWQSLNPDNRVCLAVKLIDLETGQMIGEPHLINRY